MIILDTHAWLWWTQANMTELPAGARDRVANADMVAVASVSCLEVAWLAKKGRIVLPMPIEAFLQQARTSYTFATTSKCCPPRQGPTAA